MLLNKYINQYISIYRMLILSSMRFDIKIYIISCYSFILYLFLFYYSIISQPIEEACSCNSSLRYDIQLDFTEIFIDGRNVIHNEVYD